MYKPIFMRLLSAGTVFLKTSTVYEIPWKVKNEIPKGSTKSLKWRLNSGEVNRVVEKK